ncbi:MAG: PPC domain-containing protein [Candidatus Faecousia sp.]|nr:PPC domain-containing protein [Candidatus Faecousia sp.]
MKAGIHFLRAALPWVMAVLVLAGAAAFLFGYNQEGFTGSRVKNPDAYLLDIEKMNGTDLHTLELQEGDVLQIRFETAKGELYMEIKAPDGTTIYRGNGKETTDFAVNIRQDGVYAVVVEARHAKGTIHIQAKAENP